MGFFISFGISHRLAKKLQLISPFFCKYIESFKDKTTYDQLIVYDMEKKNKKKVSGNLMVC